jgi:circadian clock protein KaiB
MVEEDEGRRGKRPREVTDSTEEFEQAIESTKFGGRYILTLYVTGTTPRSLRAIANIKSICEEYLKGRYELQVIDVYQQPRLARGDQIVAAPTLIRRLPNPLRRLVGDLSRRERVLLGLDLKARPK